MGDADVAYQVLGHGTPDILFCYGLGSHLDLIWENEIIVDFWTRVVAHSRAVLFDRRGTGVSDPIPRHVAPTWEEWAEDMGAVLDAAASDQAVLLATLEAGAIAILFAALHPERVSGLVLVNTGARFTYDGDYQMGFSPEGMENFLALVEVGWGTPEFSALVDPDRASDAEYIRNVARQQRSSATPRTAAEQYAYILSSLDVRQALPLVQAPTLVLHVRDSPFVPSEMGRFVAERIPNARFVEMPGASLGLMDGLADQVVEFITGRRPEVEVERILTTVMFTDIAGSTERAASLGDQRWRHLLDSHDRLVREQLRRFRGREIKTTGDGFFASFDGPARAIRCAGAINEAVDDLRLGIRTGLHTGECEVRGDDLGGLAVHIAARIGSAADPGEVVVSSTVKDLVIGSGIEFEDRGEHELKGVPGTWKLFAVKG